MNKVKIIAISVIGLVLLAIFFSPKARAATSGCGGWFEPSCAEQGTQGKEQQATEDTQKRLLQAVPVPSNITTSQERKNLVRRLQTFNDENKISFIYLVSYGKVMAFYTVKGKVSSVSSYLTTSEQLVDANGNQCDKSDEDSYGGSCYIVESPDLDGSYGTNGDAIFFFTTEDAYVEWKGEYMVSDQPLKLSTQPELIREIK